jgi:hypothetical protein
MTAMPINQSRNVHGKQSIFKIFKISYKTHKMATKVILFSLPGYGTNGSLTSAIQYLVSKLFSSGFPNQRQRVA